MEPKKVLVIGSAGKIFSDAVTVDIDPEHHPDVVHDLNVTPWPFPDNSFQEIVAHHVVEHLQDFASAMKEMYRICSKDGCVYIEVPHHTAWFAKDPAHKMFFGYFSFDGFIAGKTGWVTGRKFRCLKREITFHKFYRALFLHRLFNRWPLTY